MRSRHDWHVLAPVMLQTVCVRHEPGRVGQIAAQARLQRVDALLADQAPELEGAEAAAERDPPVAEVLHAAVDLALQRYQCALGEL